MSKGTILYVGNFELPDKGAAANRVMNNRKLFSELGYRVAMLGIVHEQFDGVRVSSYDQDIYEEAYPVSTAAWAKHMGSIRNIAAVAAHYSDAIMVLLYNVPFLLLKNCKAYFGKRNIKVCYDCTEWTPVTEGSFAKRFIKKWDCKLIRNRLGKESDGLIVVSKMMQKAYQDQKNLLYLPPLVDITDTIWHPNPPYTPQTFEFCFAGMLDGDKDSLDKIVEGFSKMKRDQAILRIIGVTKDAFLVHYPAMSKVLEELADSLIFMGRRSHAETISYVLGCSCYIFVRKPDTRNNAGFPTKFAEAFTCGRPIIATEISDIGEYMRMCDRGILLKSPDTEKIAAAMETVMNTSSRYATAELSSSFHFQRYMSETEQWVAQIASKEITL